MSFDFPAPHHGQSSRPPLVLASGSPRRRAMLAAGGVAFEVRVSGVDEEALAQGAPRAVALKLALAKAEAVAQQCPAGTLVLAADTMVVVDEQEVFNKPRDRAEARTMLMRLSGRRHTVVTGLALARVGGETQLDAVAAGVHFNPLGEELVTAYLASGEADDKAGAYGIQGLGSRLVGAVDGDLTGVIGLPLGRLCEFYRQATGAHLFTDGNGALLSPRQVALRAFPDLATLPAPCLGGIPD